MFNITGGEVIIIAIVALVILGPDKLPDFVRRAGRVYGEVKKISQGFKTEFRDVIEEPVREMQDTVNMAKSWFDEGKAAVGTLDDVDWNTPMTPEGGETATSEPAIAPPSAPAGSPPAAGSEGHGDRTPPIHDPFTPAVTADATPGFDDAVVVSGDGDALESTDDNVDEGDEGDDDPNFYDDAGNMITGGSTQALMDSFGQVIEHPRGGVDPA